jgi:hypothetical protein
LRASSEQFDRPTAHSQSIAQPPSALVESIAEKLRKRARNNRCEGHQRLPQQASRAIGIFLPGRVISALKDRVLEQNAKGGK